MESTNGVEKCSDGGSGSRGVPACYCFIFNIAFVVVWGNLEMEAAVP